MGEARFRYVIGEYREIERCRGCGGEALEPVLFLGELALADGLLGPEDLEAPEPLYPLTVVFCPGCSLVQIKETVPPEVLFGADYPYYSSFSPALLEHSRRNALNLLESKRLGPDSLVVEVASNDGYLLRNFVEAGVPVLGIDPAPGPVEAARAAGVDTLLDFFDLHLAERLAAEGRRADVIIANNVLAHVPDQNDVVAGFKTLLAEDGVLVIEVPYVRDLVEKCEFDTIYHEHHCYFSVTALDRLFASHDLHLNHVERLPIHGGSLRLYVEHRPAEDEGVRDLLREERSLGMTDGSLYRDFAQRVAGLREDLRRLVFELKAQGHSLAAYGAAAKGATLLGYTNIDAAVIDFVADRNVHKHGRYMPGVRIPIHGPEKLLEDRPDFVLLLAWNFEEEILEQQKAYREAGGRFLIPVPEVRIV
ncbi:MAG: class I SAM-dependent methyltransferase [Thermoleophilia bacterium]